VLKVRKACPSSQVGHPLFFHLLYLALARNKFTEVRVTYRDVFHEEAFTFAVGTNFGGLNI